MNDEVFDLAEEIIEFLNKKQTSPIVAIAALEVAKLSTFTAYSQPSNAPTAKTLTPLES